MQTHALRLDSEAANTFETLDLAECSQKGRLLRRRWEDVPAAKVAAPEGLLGAGLSALASPASDLFEKQIRASPDCCLLTVFKHSKNPRSLSGEAPSCLTPCPVCSPGPGSYGTPGALPQALGV